MMPPGSMMVGAGALAMPQASYVQGGLMQPGGTGVQNAQ